MSNFEFLKKKENEIVILSHKKLDSELPRLLWITHSEKPMKNTDSMRAYIGHLLEIKEDSILNDLITSFNQALAENKVQALNVRKDFTTKGERYWICDEGLVLCTTKWYTGAMT